MKYLYLTLLGMCFFTTNAQTSVQDGNWMSPTTWDCTCVPDPYNNVLDITVDHTVTADFFDGSTYFNGGSLTIGASGSLIQSGNGDLFMKDATTLVEGTLDMRRIAIENGSATYNGVIQNCDSLWNDSGTVVNNGTITAFDHQVYNIGSMTNNGTIMITNNMNIMGEYTNSSTGVIHISNDFSNANTLGGRALYTNDGEHIIYQDFINTTNDTIQGTGTICIGSLSTNQGTILGTVEFTTSTGSFSVNTGTVESSVVMVAGSCGFTGINEPSQNELNVFPNPFVDVLSIEGVNIKSIQVIDINGKLVHSIKSNTNSIDLSSLQAGTYFLKITDTNDATYVEKILK